MSLVIHRDTGRTYAVIELNAKYFRPKVQLVT